MSGLAILGGNPVLAEPLPARQSIGRDEVEAVTRAAESGCLSGFYGSWGDEFLGGPLVRQFEEDWRRRFGTRHAVSVNSATSGLFAAMGAIGLSPGDEVIVPPYTMSATAMAPLVYGAIPRFADIEEETFTLDPVAVEQAITPRTRAILAVNLFGHPAKLETLRTLADRHGLFLVEDNAQGPLASEAERLAGTVGHIGVFSLNYHKHIHTGEGGMCVTDDDDLALRLQMIRNHAENVVDAVGMELPVNMVGFNYRLTELGAAVGIAQLRRIYDLVSSRERIGQRLSAGLQGLEGLTPPVVRPGCRHVYYVWALRVDCQALGATRTQFAKALAAEGFPNFEGYVRPLYLLPVFQKRIALGRNGFPFTLSDIRYDAGLCPVAERMHFESLVGFEPCVYELDDARIDALIAAVRKVHAHRHHLRQID